MDDRKEKVDLQMKFTHNIRIVLLVLIMLPVLSYGQVNFDKPPDDDLGNVEDRYQELFFEALKQKGIENYDRAIDALQECIKIDGSHPVLYFELGKNYNKLKNYQAAEEALTKAISMQPDNEWFLDELYEVYVQLDDMDKAIGTVKQLVKYHPDYKQDLATLYIREKRYDEALVLIDELDKHLGPSEVRDAMRNQVYEATGNVDDRITHLKSRISSNPNNEDNYLKLIYRYSQTGKTKEAFDVAKQLLSVKPESKLVHLALYKFYLDGDDTANAINSMKIVLGTSEINADAKSKVLKDFVAFVAKNPEYEKDLIEVTASVEGTNDPKSLEDLGLYYLKSGEKEKALAQFKSLLKQEPNNYIAIKNSLLIQIDLKAYDAVIKESSAALELYPAQPLLYLVNGVAHNNLKAPDKAIDSLEMGLDFLVEDPKMEADFYQQLSVAYKQKNNITKSETFAKKAQSLKAQQ